MKLAHLADLHLGFRQYDRQTPRGGNQREADVADAFRRAVDDLLGQRPDLILLAGDIFHSVRPTNPAILHLFNQLHRLRTGLPDSPIVMIAGNHDTPRTTETGTILRLYEALGVHVVVEETRNLVFPKLDCAVLAVPHQAVMQSERPALRPQHGATINILLIHGQLPGMGEKRGTAEYGGALLDQRELAPAQWDYVALGHYNVAQQVADNAWYSGSLEYVTPNPWGQLQDEEEQGRRGKGYLLIDIPGSRVTFRPIAPARRHIDLPSIDGKRLTPKELDERIKDAVARAKPAIDDQIVRQLVFDVSRATARDLDHAAIRGFKARALHYQLDLRRPETERVAGGIPEEGGHRQALPETVRAFLEHRPLDADLDRAEFVRLGVEYVGHGVEEGGGGSGGGALMQLLRLRLVNFRQHADTELEFGPGITGIVGPNGSGKTTILEAIAWAIYGTQAVRGDKDSIRRLGAAGRSGVEVELEFRLGAHEYRAQRGLTTAALHQDGQLIANSLKAVTEKLERTIGMSHDEFFNTYFTGQKELAVMSALGKTERAAFLSRVLGYERLREAQERVREVRNAVAAEVRGLEAGLPDDAALASERKATEARLAAARAAAQRADTTRRAAEEALKREEPRWNEWVARRERTLSLDGERRMAEQAVVTSRQEFQRLDRELADALAAREQLRRLDAELAPIARLKQEVVELERLQGEAAARRADEAQLTELRRASGALERRVAALGDAADALARATAAARELHERLEAVERVVEEERTAWVRDRQYAETKRTELLKLYEEVKEQRDRIVQLGPDGTCPTCKRPLGEEYASVLALLDSQLEVITGDGKYFRQRLEQLAQPPAKVLDAEVARDRALEESRRASARAGELQAQLEERERAAAELAEARRRAKELEGRLTARPVGYDPARHDAVRGQLAKLEPIALEAAALEERARRAEGLVPDAEQAEQQLSVGERRVAELSAAVRAEGFSDAQYTQAKDRYDRAVGALREAELTVVETRGELNRAEDDVRDATRREAERAQRERQIAALKARQRIHNELDRAFSDLRSELNARMRPELAELASGFLSDLTDGRYDELQLTEDYTVAVLEGGVPKPVISGGEEDIASLVLRLAISQMIAERAGQPLSLLVLDEIFGSLDESRRQHVVGLLRRLADRFPQVVLITHIEQVREGLDRVIRVDFDPARGTSVVRDDTATLGTADAGVAA